MARCIRVVDDEPDLPELVRFDLDRIGFRVETAASPGSGPRFHCSSARYRHHRVTGSL